jgi:integrase
MASIRKRGKRWQALVRFKGALPISKTFDRRSEAEAWARRQETSIDSDEGIERVRLGRSSGLLLRELLTRYRDQLVPLKKSADRETSAINVFLRERMCRLPAEAVTPDLLSTYRDRRLKEVKPASVCRTLAIVQHAYEVAQREWGLVVPRNPVKLVKRPRIANARVRRLMPGEITTLFAGLKRSRNKILKSAIELAIETGMRRSELLSMTWMDIDAGRRVVTLATSKNGHPRTIPLTARALATLKDLSRTSDRPLPISPNALRLAWERLRRRAGLSDLHFHDLRHEAISSFFERGLSLPEVALISGHRDPRMLLRYANMQVISVLSKLDSDTQPPQIEWRTQGDGLHVRAI